MKLPVGEMSSGEEVPRSDDVHNGDSEEASTNGGGIGGGDADDNGIERGNPPNNNNVKEGGDNPFADYLWMENEDEFDQEVMRQLEEDIMISHYSDMFENSLLEDGAPGPTTASLCVMNGPIIPSFVEPVPSPGEDLDDMTRRFNRQMTFATTASRLNPNAAEFVPRSFSNVSTPH